MVNFEDLDCRADCETVQELHLYYQSEKTVASLNLLIRFIDVNAFFFIDIGQSQAANSRPKPLTIFDRRQKRFDHFSVHIIPVELIQFRQPEIIAGVI